MGCSELPGYRWLVLGSACSVERIVSWFLVSWSLTSWTPSQAIEQFMVAFCSVGFVLLVHPDPITGGFSCSYFSNLSHGPLLASALLAGSTLGRLWGDTLGACELSLALWPIFALID